MLLPASKWTHTAVEYGVFKALGLFGYSDCTPDCGYSQHPVMVPSLAMLKDPNCDSFTDFSVISDRPLFKEYVLKILKKKGITITRKSEHPHHEVQLFDGSDTVNAISEHSYAHAVCLAVLKLFNVSTVPQEVHSFEKNLAEHEEKMDNT